MPELSKQEYQILYYFYGFNQSLTKHELLDKVPELNSSTTAMVLKKLLDNGYLEIEKITYSRTVLARVYKPSIPLIEFIRNEFGEVAIEKVIIHAINSLGDPQEVEYLLTLIRERKNTLNKKIKAFSS